MQVNISHDSEAKYIKSQYCGVGVGGLHDKTNNFLDDTKGSP